MADNQEENPDLALINSKIDLANQNILEAQNAGDEEGVKRHTDALNRFTAIKQSAVDQLNNFKIENQKAALSRLESPVRTTADVKQQALNELYSKHPDEVGGFSGMKQAAEKIKSLKGDPEKTPDQIQSDIASAFDIPKDQLDVTSGLDSATRAKMSFAPTPETKMEYLQSIYGDNVRQFNLSGTPAFVVKNMDGKWKLVNEVGYHASDLAGATGEVFPAIVGAVTGLKAGQGKVSANKTSVLSNVAQGLAGEAQDIVSAYAMGQNPDYAEILKRRSVEMGMGMAFDKIIKYAMTPFAKRIGTDVGNVFAKEIESAKNLLASKGYETTAPVKYLFGREALDKQLAGISKAGDSPIVAGGQQRAIKNTLDTLGDWKEATTRSAPSKFADTMNNLKSQWDTIVQNIAKRDARSAGIIQGAFDRKFNDVATNYVESQENGRIVRGHLQNGLEVAKDLKNQAYGDFFNQANQLVTMPQQDVVAILRSGIDKVAKGQESKNSLLEAQIKELEGNIAGGKRADILEMQAKDNPELDTPDFKKHIQDLRDKAADLRADQIHFRVRRAAAEVPEGGTMGSSNVNKQIAESASADLRDAMLKKFNDAGILDQWNAATDRFNSALSGRTGLNASILDAEFGLGKLTESQVANSATADPYYIRQAIGLARATSPEAAKQTNDALKSAYLNRLGIVEGVDPKKFSFNKEVVNELWGKNPDGTLNPQLGNRMAEKLTNLQKAFEDKKVNIKKIDLGTIDKLFNSLSDDETKAMIKNIAQKASDLNQTESLEKNKLIEFARKGNFDVIDHPLFSNAAYNADPSSLSDIIRRLPAPQKASARMDFVEELYSNFPSDRRTTTGIPLWDGKAAVQKLNADKAFKSRIRIVMGDEFLNSFEAASKMLEANTVVSREQSQLGVKASATPSGIKLFGVGALTIVPKKVMAGLYGADSLRPMFRILAQNVGPEVTGRNLQNYMSKVTAGRSFITAIAHQARNDPDFRAAVQNTIKSNSDDIQQQIDRYESNIPQDL